MEIWYLVIDRSPRIFSRSSSETSPYWDTGVQVSKCTKDVLRTAQKDLVLKCFNSYSEKWTYYPTPKSVFKNTNTWNIIFLRLMNSEWNENWCVPSLGPAWLFLKVWEIFIAYFSRKIKNKVEEYYTLQHMERNKTFSKSTNGGSNFHMLKS